LWSTYIPILTFKIVTNNPFSETSLDYYKLLLLEFISKTNKYDYSPANNWYIICNIFFIFFLFFFLLRFLWRNSSYCFSWPIYFSLSCLTSNLRKTIFIKVVGSLILFGKFFSPKSHWKRLVSEDQCVPVSENDTKALRSKLWNPQARFNLGTFFNPFSLTLLGERGAH